MNDIQKKLNSTRASGQLTSIMNSLAAIKAEGISSTEMFARMVLIEGLPAWCFRGSLEDVQESYKSVHPDTQVTLSVCADFYLHIARKALEEAKEGRSPVLGIANAIRAMDFYLCNAYKALDEEDGRSLELANARRALARVFDSDPRPSDLQELQEILQQIQKTRTKDLSELNHG